MSLLYFGWSKKFLAQLLMIIILQIAVLSYSKENGTQWGMQLDKQSSQTQGLNFVLILFLILHKTECVSEYNHVKVRTLLRF